ncbi:2TM domain-containing protein [Aureivirga sp. CE67]|uniref:2TM domain-containing protein n=1 Tax=Aureivirga sp. CE67 TaxID=1788983 RepID=UPI0018CA5A7C|nr:2TM domain-containing protein [Aureivirga sp. CE67]
MNNLEQHELYEAARRRVRQKRGVFVHLVILIIVSVFLYIGNVVFDYGKQEYGNWYEIIIFLWLFFWILHFINVFITKQFMGKKWERAQTEKLMKKYKDKMEQIEKKIIEDEITKKKEDTGEME